jgi:protease I
MANRLNGKRVAMLVAQGFEQVEMTGPRQALLDEGATVDLVSPQQGKVKAWQHDRWGDEFEVDVALDDARPEDYDALVIPGGVMSPDHLRMNEKAVRFVRSFFTAEKPLAAICHGPWMLVEADVVRGRTITSWPSLQTDVENAGATWVDRPVVTEQGLVTSRKPDDIPAFNGKVFEEIAEGVHAGRR